MLVRTIQLYLRIQLPLLPHLDFLPLLRRQGLAPMHQHGGLFSLVF